MIFEITKNIDLIVIGHKGKTNLNRILTEISRGATT